MKGARDFYQLMYDSSKIKDNELRKLRLLYGWNGGDSEAYIHGNMIFVLSSHARGKCFRIFVTDVPDATDEEIKKSAFEVYGVVSGQPGWTETYGWLHIGPWIDYTNSYFEMLSEKLRIFHEEVQRAKEELSKKNQLEKQNMVEKLASLFPN